MTGKFLLIALVCVSVAQVHGGELENAINNGLRRVRAMNENGRNRCNDAIEDSNEKSELVDYKTIQFLDRAKRVQESSKQTLRSVAAAMEQKAREDNRPQSVFECIKSYEKKANLAIASFTTTFGVNIELVRSTKQINIEQTSITYDNMEEDLAVKYEKTVLDLNNCKNIRCVNTVIGSFATYLNSMYAKIRRVERQIATIMTNFNRDAKNHFTNSNRQITMFRSAAIRNIRNCYYRGERDSQDIQE